MDISEFRKHGKEVIDVIADYYEGLNQVPPMSTAKPGYLYKLIPHEAPREPESFEDIKSDIETRIMPGITHWQSGNFFGWYSSNSSFPAILGEMYSSMFSVVRFNWICSPAATELETVVVDWLGKLIGLNKRFLSINKDGTEGVGGGVIHGSASEALVVSMIAARRQMIAHLTSQGASDEEAESMQHRFVAYVSDQTHSAGQKGGQIIGCKTHVISTDANFRLTKDALETAIADDRNAGLVPFFVCGTFGTTNTAAIDDLSGIADVAEVENIWFHVDAAYAGSALACPEFHPLAIGSERADSFNINPHKWMLTNFDCSVLWVADSTHLVDALRIDREYLPRVKGEKSFVKDYRDWELALGSKFRALKLWFVMRTYGVLGIQRHIRMHISQAKWLEEQLLNDGRFEIMAPTVFGLVVFRIKPQAIVGSSVALEESEKSNDRVNSANVELVKRIQEDNRVFLVGTKVKGNDVVRAAIGTTYGTQENVERLVLVIKQLTTKVIGCAFINPE
ncbi:pyridoxal phosphate-dependent transferase [Coemansia spiralis]|nr:pyridoxal phosphate-dependent transferase [Coemansia spiralis]